MKMNKLIKSIGLKVIEHERWGKMYQRDIEVKIACRRCGKEHIFHVDFKIPIKTNRDDRIRFIIWNFHNRGWLGEKPLSFFYVVGNNDKRMVCDSCKEEHSWRADIQHQAHQGWYKVFDSKPLSKWDSLLLQVLRSGKLDLSLPIQRSRWDKKR